MYSMTVIFQLKNQAHREQLVTSDVVSGLKRRFSPKGCPDLCGGGEGSLPISVYSSEAPSKRREASYLTGETRNQESRRVLRAPLQVPFHSLDSPYPLGSPSFPSAGGVAGPNLGGWLGLWDCTLLRGRPMRARMNTL